MKRRAISAEPFNGRDEENLGPSAALIGLGGNVGDPVAHCREAVRRLEEHPAVTVLRCSSLYRTEPLGKHDQNWFVNGVVLCETTLAPEQLLVVLQDIEKTCGRVRRERWGPRTLDLDLLCFGDVILDTERLTLPHPRLHERRFVLVPLLEIVPHWRHPVLPRTGRELLDALGGEPGQSVEPLVL
ncbi:MAG: 2-amino-4-hydroxy-6-hydroxymethyldihydropteridine diphosphokinase [Syntrophobacteraceae bacterium]|jgi:2-amino-4-hydroxy-6-hydroxymethyldihydropteridine diphosphokinase|nr:2-amino-4-hydroxy-6-hydroxymethyldihydropteridine diphosphokinase [Syntrophobacteraceae bacterium]